MRAGILQSGSDLKLRIALNKSEYEYLKLACPLHDEEPNWKGTIGDGLLIWLEQRNKPLTDKERKATAVHNIDIPIHEVKAREERVKVHDVMARRVYEDGKPCLRLFAYGILAERASAPAQTHVPMLKGGGDADMTTITALMREHKDATALRENECRPNRDNTAQNTAVPPVGAAVGAPVAARRADVSSPSDPAPATGRATFRSDLRDTLLREAITVINAQLLNDRELIAYIDENGLLKVAREI